MPQQDVVRRRLLLDPWRALLEMGAILLPVAVFVFYHALTEGRRGRRWAGLTESKNRPAPLHR